MVTYLFCNQKYLLQNVLNSTCYSSTQRIGFVEPPAIVSSNLEEQQKEYNDIVKSCISNWISCREKKPENPRENNLPGSQKGPRFVWLLLDTNESSITSYHSYKSVFQIVCERTSILFLGLVVSISCQLETTEETVVLLLEKKRKIIIPRFHMASNISIVKLWYLYMLFLHFVFCNFFISLLINYKRK